jgi:hypothetical protein
MENKMDNERIEKIEKGFLNDVSNHSMEVVLNDGVNRHLIFSNNGSFCYRFGLVTWSGYLCIYGDMGTSVFSRTTDMFNFFRMDDNDFNKKKEGLSINPGYWYEKLLSISRFGGASEFSIESFKEGIKEEYDQIVSDNSLTDEEAEALWTDIEDDILNYVYDEGEEGLMRRAIDFKSSEGIEFNDFWEHSYKEYTSHFIWQLFAIVWGISIFDKLTLNLENRNEQR